VQFVGIFANKCKSQYVAGGKFNWLVQWQLGMFGPIPTKSAGSSNCQLSFI